MFTEHMLAFISSSSLLFCGHQVHIVSLATSRMVGLDGEPGRWGLWRGMWEPLLQAGCVVASVSSSRQCRQLRAGVETHTSLVAPFDAWITSSLGPANSNTSSEISSNWWWATSGLWNENSKTFDWVQVKWIFIICSVNFCQDEWYCDNILIISEVGCLFFFQFVLKRTNCKHLENLLLNFAIQAHPWHFTEWNRMLNVCIQTEKYRLQC